MTGEIIPSDVALLDLLRKHEALKIAELAAAMEVTATAVRQRLTRLMAQGFVARVADRAGRGRPSHKYALTAKGRRQSGTNFADLAIALWEEIRAIGDPEVRRGLLRRLAQRLAEQYQGHVQGETVEDRMAALAEMFQERRIPFAVGLQAGDEAESHAGLPVLTALACPYPELAEKDRSVCALERMMFAEVLQSDLRLTKCRLDGGSCCTFEASPKASA